MSERFRQAILRTLAFHETWQYAPTYSELIGTLDTRGISLSREEIEHTVLDLEIEKKIQLVRGRYGFPSSIERLVIELERRDLFQARKLRRAKRIAAALVRLGGVRFVALANTTALGAARDLGDLDFFIVVRRGSLWTTRLIAGATAKILGVQPKGDEVRDAVCLSYFISDDALDLSSHQIAHDDPYFRYWFLSLLPLADDGIGKELWERNAILRERFPYAERWIVSPDLQTSMPVFRIPFVSLFESLARSLQEPRLPPAVQALKNKDSRVIVSQSVLKFHVEDAREQFRDLYRARVKTLQCDP